MEKRLQVLEEEVKELRKRLNDLELKHDKKPKPNPHIAEIRKNFLSGYLDKYNREYPAWGAKQNGLAKSMLSSVAIERATILIRYYFLWNDPRVVKAGHPFEMLVVRIVELDTLAHNYKEHKTRVALAETKERMETQQSREIAEVAAHVERINSSGDRSRIQVAPQLAANSDEPSV